MFKYLFALFLCFSYVKASDLNGDEESSNALAKSFDVVDNFLQLQEVLVGKLSRNLRLNFDFIWCLAFEKKWTSAQTVLARGLAVNSSEFSGDFEEIIPEHDMQTIRWYLTNKWKIFEFKQEYEHELRIGTDQTKYTRNVNWYLFNEQKIKAVSVAAENILMHLADIGSEEARYWISNRLKNGHEIIDGKMNELRHYAFDLQWVSAGNLLASFISYKAQKSSDEDFNDLHRLYELGNERAKQILIDRSDSLELHTNAFLESEGDASQLRRKVIDGLLYGYYGFNEDHGYIKQISRAHKWPEAQDAFAGLIGSRLIELQMPKNFGTKDALIEIQQLQKELLELAESGNNQARRVITFGYEQGLYGYEKNHDKLMELGWEESEKVIAEGLSSGWHGFEKNHITLKQIAIRLRGEGRLNSPIVESYCRILNIRDFVEFVNNFSPFST